MRNMSPSTPGLLSPYTCSIQWHVVKQMQCARHQLSRPNSCCERIPESALHGYTDQDQVL